MWAVFGSESDMFGRADQQWMINFRVRDLDARLASFEQLASLSRSTRSNTRTAGSPSSRSRRQPHSALAAQLTGHVQADGGLEAAS